MQLLPYSLGRLIQETVTACEALLHACRKDSIILCHEQAGAQMRCPM